jgi:hypothetical protein
MSTGPPKPNARKRFHGFSLFMVMPSASLGDRTGQRHRSEKVSGEEEGMRRLVTSERRTAMNAERVSLMSVGVAVGSTLGIVPLAAQVDPDPQQRSKP